VCLLLQSACLAVKLVLIACSEKCSPNKSVDRKSVSHRVSQESKQNVNVNVDKSPSVSRRRSQLEKSVETCSENESDTDKRHTFTRRRSFIRPDRLMEFHRRLLRSKHTSRTLLSLISGVRRNS